MTEDNDSGAGHPGGSFPPPPPVDSPTVDDSGGSIGMGVALGFVGTLLASFSPILPGLDGAFFFGLFLLPILLVVAIALAVKRSTRRTGIGMLSGFAVGLVVSAGTCLYWLSTADFG